MTVVYVQVARLIMRLTAIRIVRVSVLVRL